MREALAASHTRGGGLQGPKGQALKLTVGTCGHSVVSSLTVGAFGWRFTSCLSVRAFGRSVVSCLCGGWAVKDRGTLGRQMIRAWRCGWLSKAGQASTRWAPQSLHGP